MPWPIERISGSRALTGSDSSPSAINQMRRPGCPKRLASTLMGSCCRSAQRSTPWRASSEAMPTLTPHSSDSGKSAGRLLACRGGMYSQAVGFLQFSGKLGGRFVAAGTDRTQNAGAFEHYLFPRSVISRGVPHNRRQWLKSGKVSSTEKISNSAVKSAKARMVLAETSA